MSVEYTQQKGALLQVLDELARMAAEKENGSAESLLTEAAQRLKDETITLVVLGEFKRGKSTFINALLGRNVLPTAIVPLTAIPTIIRYGRDTEARVVFETGDVQAIPAEQIPDYVTERHNPKNVKKVREVLLTDPSEYLRQGIILVDTPGVGSVYVHNTDAAYAYLPRADAGVFIISVDAPLGQTEVDYLRDIQKYVHKFVFVLNKVDIAGDEDLREALDFTRNTLAEVTGMENPNLLTLSAKLALEAKLHGDPERLKASRMAELERFLAGIIEKEKAALVLSASASKGLRILNEFQLELELWCRSMDDTLEELERKAGAFAGELENLDQEREDSIYLLYREVEKLTAKVTEGMQEFEKKSLGLLSARLDQYIEEIWENHSVRRVTELAQEYTREIILDALRRQRITERERIKDDFERVSNRFFDRIEQIVDRMMDMSAEIFQVPVQKVRYKDYVLENRFFYFHLWDHPTFIPSFEELTVTGLLPKGLLKKKVQSKARANLAELLARNCGRVRVDIVDGLTEQVRRVAGDLRLRADAVGQGLQKAVNKVLAEKRAGTVNRERAARLAAAERQRLARLRGVLEPLTNT
ncbi:MAG: dynamin family protein [Candidatus Desulforudis sp.]|nr:dynamin family protein [Desulforudis sp.]